MSLTNSKSFRSILAAAVITAAALLAGLLWNGFHPKGLPLGLLTLSTGRTALDNAWRPVESDSAFVLWMTGKALFVDIRPEHDYNLDHIPGAIHLNFRDLVNGRADLPADSCIIIYDGQVMSHQAHWASQRLISDRRERPVGFIRNGFKGWQDYGFPVEGVDP